jgi:hypothetical protein
MDRGLPARAAWLVAPVLLAGLAHVGVLKANLLGRLAMPLDAGGSWRGRPIFGANKTWRGPVVMTLGTALTTRLLHVLHPPPWQARIGSDWTCGAVVGLAYVLAELPNSFVKRRLRVPPGGRSRRLGGVQYVVDQADSVAGCLVAARLVYRPSWLDVAAAFVLGIVAHIGVDALMHTIGVKRRPHMG